MSDRTPTSTGTKVVIALLAALIAAVIIGIVVFVNVSHQAQVDAKKAECQSSGGAFAYFMCIQNAER